MFEVSLRWQDGAIQVLIYALEYLADLFEGVEDTDLAKEYGYEKQS